MGEVLVLAALGLFPLSEMYQSINHYTEGPVVKINISLSKSDIQKEIRRSHYNKIRVLALLHLHRKLFIASPP